MNAKVSDEVKKHYRAADITISQTGGAKKWICVACEKPITSSATGAQSISCDFWLQVRDLQPFPEPPGPQVRNAGPSPGRSRSGPLWLQCPSPFLSAIP